MRRIGVLLILAVAACASRPSGRSFDLVPRETPTPSPLVYAPPQGVARFMDDYASEPKLEQGGNPFAYLVRFSAAFRPDESWTARLDCTGMRLTVYGGDVGAITTEEVGPLGADDCDHFASLLRARGFWEMAETDPASAATADGAFYEIAAYEARRGYHRSWHQVGNVPEFDKTAEFVASLARRNRGIPSWQRRKSR